MLAVTKLKNDIHAFIEPIRRQFNNIVSSCEEDEFYDSNEFVAKLKEWNTKISLFKSIDAKLLSEEIDEMLFTIDGWADFVYICCEDAIDICDKILRVFNND